MSRLTPVWTEQHTRIALIVSHVAIGVVATVSPENIGLALLVSGLFVAAILVGLVFDLYVSVVAGILTGAVWFLLAHVTRSSPTSFTAAVGGTFFLVTAPIVANLAVARTHAEEGSAPLST
ncbi:MAG TPA: hypothetical protein VGE01_04990, partial [Fimbriimonas sp.]